MHLSDLIFAGSIAFFSLSRSTEGVDRAAYNFESISDPRFDAAAKTSAISYRNLRSNEASKSTLIGEDGTGEERGNVEEITNSMIKVLSDARPHVQKMDEDISKVSTSVMDGASAVRAFGTKAIDKAADVAERADGWLATQGKRLDGETSELFTEAQRGAGAVKAFGKDVVDEAADAAEEARQWLAAQGKLLDEETSELLTEAKNGAGKVRAVGKDAMDEVADVAERVDQWFAHYGNRLDEETSELFADAKHGASAVKAFGNNAIGKAQDGLKDFFGWK